MRNPSLLFAAALALADCVIVTIVLRELARLFH